MAYDSFNREIRRKNINLFIIGLLSYTSITIIGTIGISELLLVFLSPFLFLMDFPKIRKEGTLILHVLSLLWMGGAILSDWIAGTPFQIAIRGVAFPMVTFAALTGIGHFLRNNLYGLKYLIIGMFCSYIISIFTLQSHVSGGYEAGTAEALQAVVEYKLFWPVLISTILTLPIQAWYFSVPNLYAFSSTLVCAFVNLYFGGRSLFLIGFTSFVLLMSVNKKVRNIVLVKRNAVKYLILFFVIGFASSYIYKYAVKRGYLGEVEEIKYARQTERGEGIFALILSGRSDFFISMFAAFDRPILGWGTHALDMNGYMVDFARKYGTDKGMEDALRWAKIMGGTPRLPMHSHLTGFWCWHGIFGGLFWLYAIYIIIMGAFRGISNHPWAFGYIAVTLPFQVWTMLFSPYSHRIPECTLIIFCALISKNKPNMTYVSSSSRLWQ